jgi:hypothetical protein
MDITVVLSARNRISCVGGVSVRNVGMTINIATQICSTANKTFYQSLKNKLTKTNLGQSSHMT